MRLHRLELTGFGPFRERQSVDFEAFERDGIFLISGRTGAGKSSILDGVCFALYGSVPRYESGDKRLRSDHCEPGDPTEVRLEFTVGDRRWRVTRAPEYLRPSLRGGGLTTEPTRAELEELVDGAWVGRAGKPRDVGLLLDDVLGLNAQQFQQVILLAQNRFSRFLLASGTERQSLLRALFGTRRYEEYARELGERSKAAQHELDALGERARTLLDQAERLIAAHEPEVDDAGGEAAATLDLPARRAAVDLGAQRAAYRLDTLARERAAADDARAAAEAAHAERVALAKAQAELGRARERLTTLEAATAEIADDRRRLQHARSAEVLRAPLEAALSADQAAASSAAAAAAADAAWERLAAGTDDELAADLSEVVERLTGELAVWTAALAARDGARGRRGAGQGCLRRGRTARDRHRRARCAACRGARRARAPRRGARGGARSRRPPRPGARAARRDVEPAGCRRRGGAADRRAARSRDRPSRCFGGRRCGGGGRRPAAATPSGRICGRARDDARRRRALRRLRRDRTPLACGARRRPGDRRHARRRRGGARYGGGTRAHRRRRGEGGAGAACRGGGSRRRPAGRDAARAAGHRGRRARRSRARGGAPRRARRPSRRAGGARRRGRGVTCGPRGPSRRGARRGSPG